MHIERKNFLQSKTKLRLWKKIINQLKELKKLGATGIKQSLEDEGAGFNEIILMRKITKQVGLKLNIKICGCEAKNIFVHQLKLME